MQFFSNVLKLVTGSIIAQSIGILLAPLFTRIFTPEAFGLYALFTSITGIISVIICLRYELSIMLPKSKYKAFIQLIISCASVIFVSFISTVIIYYSSESLSSMLNTNIFQIRFFLIPVALLVGGILKAMNYWLTRLEKFGTLSFSKVIASTITNILKLIIGLLGFKTGFILILSSIAGQLISCLFLIKITIETNFNYFFRKFEFNHIKAGIIRYKEWPLFSTWSGLLNSISQQLPIWFFSSYNDLKVVGFYSLGYTTLSLPSGIIGQAVSQVFFQQAAELNRRTDNLPILINQIFRRLFALGLFPVIIISFLGEEIFILIFGVNWSLAGVYVEILAPLLLIQFIYSPLSSLFSVKEKQRLALVTNIILVLVRGFSLVIGLQTNNILYTLKLYSFTSVFMYVGVIILVFFISKVNLYSILEIMIKYTFISIIFSSMFLYVNLTTDASMILQVSLGIICTSLYYSFLLKKDKILESFIYKD